MWINIFIGFVVVCAAFLLIDADPNYVIVHERAELVSYNSSLVTKDIIFTIRKFNLTSLQLNTSFILVQDILDRKLMLDIRIDKLYGSQYKRTGTSLSFSLCKFWEKNTFGMREDIQKYGHLEACNLVKGKYYLRNYAPDVSLFPKYIPFGSYRVNIEINHPSGAQLFLLHWYAKVEKVIKW